VRRQLDAIGQVFTGGQALPADFENLFNRVDGGVLGRARSLAARQSPAPHTAVLLQIAMPIALAEQVMYVSHAEGWSPEVLPDRPASDDPQECNFPEGEEGWPKVFLRDVWGVKCSDSGQAKKYFDATSTSERYRILKHQQDIDLQARVLMTRQASGFEGDEVKMYAHGSLFQNHELAEVTFALAEGVRKTLVPGQDS